MLEKSRNFASEIRKESDFRPSRRRTGRTSTDSAIQIEVAQSSVPHTAEGRRRMQRVKGVTVHGLQVVRRFDSVGIHNR